MGFDIEGCVGDTGSRNLFLSSDQLGLYTTLLVRGKDRGINEIFLSVDRTHFRLLDSKRWRIGSKEQISLIPWNYSKKVCIDTS